MESGQLHQANFHTNMAILMELLLIPLQLMDYQEIFILQPILKHAVITRNFIFT